MKEEEFTLLITTYPDDPELQSEMLAYYNNPATKKDDEANFIQALAYQIKSWAQWKTFLLVITAGIYAIYYFFSHKNQVSRNIFSILSTTNKNVSDLLKPFEPEVKKTNKKRPHEKVNEESLFSEHSSEPKKAKSPEDSDDPKLPATPESSQSKEKPDEQQAPVKPKKSKSQVRLDSSKKKDKSEEQQAPVKPKESTSQASLASSKKIEKPEEQPAPVKPKESTSQASLASSKKIEKPVEQPAPVKLNESKSKTTLSASKKIEKPVEKKAPVKPKTIASDKDIKEPSEEEIDESTLKFFDNMRICFRLRNGNFVAQGYDNNVTIINDTGHPVQVLNTAIEGIRVPSEITHFAQLEDGCIVGAGESITTKNGILFIWNEAETLGIEFENTAKIHSLDTLKSQILCSTDYNHANEAFVIQCESKDGTIKHYQHKISNHIGLVSFVGINGEFAYFEQDSSEPKRYLKRFSDTGEILNNNFVIISRQNHIMRISDTNVMTAANDTVLLWDEFMVNPATWQSPDNNPITQIACSPNKQFLALSDASGNIFLMPTSMAADKQDFFSVDPIGHLFVSDEGEISVAVSKDAEGLKYISHIKFYNTETFEAVDQREPEATALNF